MKPLYIFFLIVLFSGCSLERAIERATSTAERAEETQNTLKEKYPELVAKKFAEWFPAKDSITVVHDTVSVVTYLKETAAPTPEPQPVISNPAPVVVYRSVVASPDVSFYTNTISALKRKVQKSAAALEAAKERYRQVEHTLFQEQEAHQTTKAEAEKARKYKTAWFWFLLFLGLVIAWFIIGKIFRFV